MEHVHMRAKVKDEGVSLIEAVPFAINLSNDNSFLLSALEVQQTWLVFLRFDMGETALEPPVEDIERLEKLKESSAFASVHLAMLNRSFSEKVIELDALVRGHSNLILRAFFAQPKVDVPGLFFAIHVGLEHKIRVTRVECSMLRLVNLDDSELWAGGVRPFHIFYPPHLDPWPGITSALVLFLERCFVKGPFLVLRATIQGHVSIFDLDFVRFLHLQVLSR
mmetsp:Transcript_5478/g.10750  ORF Transcript_5478/g.10750 Transcript_5478/m.10750 type:complete len:222 (-) Transcript_5478:28-693(-)